MIFPVGQWVWYLVQGEPYQGRIVGIEKRGKYAKQTWYLIERPPKSPRMVPEKWIRAGEIERCRHERERALSDADTDEWGLLGARDWGKEKAILEGMTK